MSFSDCLLDPANFLIEKDIIICKNQERNQLGRCTKRLRLMGKGLSGREDDEHIETEK